MFWTVTSHPNRAARRKRKKLGGWNAIHATQEWVTRDGRFMRLREMGDDHLENALKFLIGKATHAQAVTDWRILDAGEILTVEQRGKPWTDYVFDIYWDMMKEYEFRGLSVAWLHPYINRCILNTLSEDLDDVVDTINDELRRFKSEVDRSKGYANRDLRSFG